MDATIIDVTTQFISTIGFPIFVAIWLLFRDAKEKERMATALDKLSEAILVLHTKIDQFTGGGK